jgi:predicted MFS family arabinose efflux permease
MQADSAGPAKTRVWRRSPAIAALYTVTVTPMNVSPLLVAAMITVWGASEQQSGRIMTLELLAMSLTAVAVSTFARRTPAPGIIVGTLLLLAAVHWASAWADGFAMLMILRMVAGVCAGIMLFAVNVSIARSDDPVGHYGAAVAVASVVGIVLFLVMPRLTESHGLPGTYGVLAAVVLLSLLLVPRTGAVPLQPANAMPGTTPGVQKIRPRNVLLVATLFAIAMTQAALYAFSARMGEAVYGLAVRDMGVLLAVSYVATVPASALASWLGYRCGRLLPLMVGFGCYCATTLSIGLTHSGVLFAIAYVAYNFAFFFTLPYLLGFPGSLDSSGRLGGIGVGTMFAGASLGAFLGGELVTHAGYHSLGIVAAATGAGGALILGLITTRIRSPASVG